MENSWSNNINIYISIVTAPRFLKMEFMPKQDQGRYSIVAELGKGLDLEKSKAIAKDIEEIVIK